jgi:transposase InsO family protein
MGLSRSTYYDAPAVQADDGEIVAAMSTICDEFEAYGYRRVGAELRHRGLVVNSKKVRRLMREHDLQPKRRRRFVATTDSDHDGPIFPDLARDRIVDGPNQLWVADITPAFAGAGSTSPLRRASFIWRPSWMPGRAASLAMRSAVRSMPALPLRR